MGAEAYHRFGKTEEPALPATGGGRRAAASFDAHRGTSPAGLTGSASLGVGEGRGGVEDCGSGRLLLGGGFVPPGPGDEGAFASVAAGGAGTASGRIRRRAS